MFNILKRISSINAHQGKQSGNQHKLHLVPGISHRFSMSHSWELLLYSLTKVFKPSGNKLTVGQVSQVFCSWLLPLHKNIISHIKCYPQNTSLESNFFHFSCRRAAKTYCLYPFLATETFPQGWHFPAISTVASVWTVWVSR